MWAVETKTLPRRAIPDRSGGVVTVIWDFAVEPARPVWKSAGPAAPLQAAGPQLVF